ncbi:Nicotinamidase-related amidase [Duganella sp. CF402]|uniref:isochorismatase family protein n=1 Tax=unclassified Duganella TaxID=2636909 RepID=UPI0008B9EDE8|nr:MULTISPECIES: isochorismatase family protein [unclassified Duganella]RZT09575.1 nicotinamidase-related amidase [Duganella sp. BK701]SEL51675.1 Nicotinamidase-related amidase [Duganella sp. CF402]
MRRALIVVDVQNEYFTGNMKIEYPPVAVSLPNITRAMDAARAADIPVVVVQHDAPEQSPIFAKGSPAWQLHEEVAQRSANLHINKTYASVFTGTGLAQWVADNGIDTLTIVGYMTHNCDAATIYEAAHKGLSVEFLSDASGSPSYENAAGKASAEEIHRVFSTVFHTGFAAVATTEAWIAAAREGKALERDNIYLSVQRTLKA